MPADLNWPLRSFRYCSYFVPVWTATFFPESDTFGIYYRKSDVKLGKALRSAIATLKRNGTLKKLAKKQQIPVSDVK